MIGDIGQTGRQTNSQPNSQTDGTTQTQANNETNAFLVHRFIAEATQERRKESKRQRRGEGERERETHTRTDTWRENERLAMFGAHATGQATSRVQKPKSTQETRNLHRPLELSTAAEKEYRAAVPFYTFHRLHACGRTGPLEWPGLGTECQD